MSKKEVGISKERIIELLAEGNDLRPSFAESIYKIIKENNEELIKNMKKDK